MVGWLVGCSVSCERGRVRDTRACSGCWYCHHFVPAFCAISVCRVSFSITLVKSEKVEFARWRTEESALCLPFSSYTFGNRDAHPPPPPGCCCCACAGGVFSAFLGGLIVIFDGGRRDRRRWRCTATTTTAAAATTTATATATHCHDVTWKGERRFQRRRWGVVPWHPVR